MSTRTFGALALLAASALSSPALADDAAQETGAVSISANANASGPRYSARRSNVGDLRIHAGLHFGFGGELEVDPERGFDVEEDLDPTIGTQVGVDYVLMEYFALGGELRLSWWKPDDWGAGNPDRSMFIDINVKPRGRYMFSNVPIEVYGTLPLGLSIAALDDDLGMDGGAGFNLGFGAGATYFITSQWGVNTELLGVWHWFNGETDVTNIDTDNSTAQFYLTINAVFAI